MMKTVISLCILVISCKKELKTTPKTAIVKNEIIEVHMDSSTMPSYANPNTYKIVKTSANYYMQWPGGTIYTKPFKTAEEVQAEINSTASDSYKKWVESGGVDY